MPTVLFAEDSGLGAGSPVVALPGTGTSVPRGIEAYFEYNNLTLNDRSVIDKFRVISIDGLDDPDVRDSREENPARDGETIYDSLYGGRTLALNGRVEAYTLHKLRDMQQALRTAFTDLSTEKPFYFLTGNSSLDHFIRCKKFSKNQWGEEQRDKHTFFRDFLITLRASNPRFLRNIVKTSSMQVADLQMSVSNLGNFWAEPILKFEGPLSNIAFDIEYPDSSTEHFALKTSVSLSGGEFYEVDISNNTIVDQTGANKFSDLDFDSDWIKLQPGANLIVNDTTSGAGTISVRYRDSWI